MRRSWISHLRAAGIDDADLADVAGYTVETMLGHYTHALKQSFDAHSARHWMTASSGAHRDPTGPGGAEIEQ
jgi:hypothetical protein